LGTRQHSDIATSEKKWHQQWKCLKTTSNEMGLRVCGGVLKQPIELEHSEGSENFHR
jgi:hypothetical protein